MKTCAIAILFGLMQLLACVPAIAKEDVATPVKALKPETLKGTWVADCHCIFGLKDC